MASITAAAGGGNWTTGGTWTGGSAPTAADDAILGAGSGNVTVDTGAVCRSLDANAYTGTLTHTAAVTLTIGDGTAGASNRALRLGAGMTYTLGNATTSAITFATTSTTQQTVDFAGKTHGNLVFGASGTPNFAITSAFAQAAAASITSTFGHFHWDGAADNSGLTHAYGSFVATASNVRTIALGNSTHNPSGTTTPWNVSGSLNVTVTTGTSIINFPAGTAGTTRTSNLGRTGHAYGTLNYDGPQEWSIGSGATAVALTRTGTPDVAGGFHLSLGLPANGTMTVTGTMTLTGTSTAQPVMLWPGNNAVPSTLIVTGCNLVFSYVNFQDVIFNNGGADLDLSGETGGTGDCGGNSMTGGGTLIFNAPEIQTWNSSGAGSWSDSSKWASGRVPRPQDPLVIGTTSASPTIVFDGQWLGASVTLTSGTGVVTLRSDTVPAANILGSVILRTGAALTNGSGAQWYLNSRVLTTTFTFNGGTVSSNILLSAGNGGMITVTDSGTFAGSFAQRSGAIFLPTGVTLTMNTYSSTASNTAAKSSIAGSGKLALSGTGTIFSATNGATVNAMQNSVIRVTNTSASSKTIAGNGLTFGVLEIVGGGSGAVIITGANNFLGAPQVLGGTKTITLPGSTTTTFRSGQNAGLGNGTNVVTFGASAGSATVALVGQAEWDYVSMTNIIAISALPAYAGSHSTDGTGNTNWLFSDAPRTAPSPARGWRRDVRSGSKERKKLMDEMLDRRR